MSDLVPRFSVPSMAPLGRPPLSEIVRIKFEMVTPDPNEIFEPEEVDRNAPWRVQLIGVRIPPLTTKVLVPN